MVKAKETKDLKSKVLDVAVFVIIATLVITSVFNFNKIFMTEPDYDVCNVGYNGKTIPIVTPVTQDCNYSQTEINVCSSQGGNLIYNTDCTTKCDFCYQALETQRQAYEKKASWFRIIFSLLVALIVVNINFKEKLIYYAIITGSLISMIAGTIGAYSILKQSLFPIVTTVEILFVLLIYNIILKKTKQKK
ncbi:MAG: hypothetical protein WCX82_02880 [archaeon]|jgi:hypothetical protein